MLAKSKKILYVVLLNCKEKIMLKVDKIEQIAKTRLLSGYPDKNNFRIIKAVKKPLEHAAEKAVEVIREQGTNIDISV